MIKNLDTFKFVSILTHSYFYNFTNQNYPSSIQIFHILQIQSKIPKISNYISVHKPQTTSTPKQITKQPTRNSQTQTLPQKRTATTSTDPPLHIQLLNIQLLNIQGNKGSVQFAIFFQMTMAISDWSAGANRLRVQGPHFLA